MTLPDNSTNKQLCSASTVQVQSNEMQCPFIWMECYTKFDEIDWVKPLKTKLSRHNCNDWRLYSFKLLLGCIYAHKHEEDKAIETLDSCEKHVKEKSNESFFIEIVEGMLHVICASRYYLNLQMDNNDSAEKIAANMKSFKDLSKESQAAVWATKAYILCEFGYDAMIEALKCSRLAVKLDPDDGGRRQGAWYCLTGKIHLELRRVRSSTEMPTKEELSMLDRSTKINPFPVHLIILSDSYREAAKVLLKNSYQTYKAKSDKMCHTSKRIYEEVMAKNILSVGILRRCGMGLIKLPSAFRNLKLAEQAFEKALKIAPENPVVLLGMGYFQEWQNKNDKEALEYYKKSYECGYHGAGLRVIMLKYKFDNNYNPLDDCDRYISNLKYLLKTRMKLEWETAFTAVKGEYYFFVKEDLLAAAKEWEKAIDTLPDAKYLNEYRHAFQNNKNEFSLYTLLIKKIKDALRSKKFSNEDEAYLTRLKEKCEANEYSSYFNQEVY